MSTIWGTVNAQNQQGTGPGESRNWDNVGKEASHMQWSTKMLRGGLLERWLSVLPNAERGLGSARKEKCSGRDGDSTHMEQKKSFGLGRRCGSIGTTDCVYDQDQWDLAGRCTGNFGNGKGNVPSYKKTLDPKVLRKPRRTHRSTSSSQYTQQIFQQNLDIDEVRNRQSKHTAMSQNPRQPDREKNIRRTRFRKPAGEEKRSKNNRRTCLK